MTSQTPIITVIGSLNVDLVTYTGRLPSGGETLTASSFHTGLGGKGANQAVACAKLSRTRVSPKNGTVSVHMVGAVGDDVYGQSMKSSLEAEYGIDVSGIQVRTGGKTGVAVIIVEESSGENRILLSPESNWSLLPGLFQELPTPLPDLIVLQLEIPLPTVLEILKSASAQGVPVLLNPAPAPANGLPAACYEMITHLIVNESEAALLTGVETTELDTADGVRKAAQTLQSRGSKNIIITLGARGVYYLGQEKIQGFVEALPAKVVDTTAAGDTFVGMYALHAVGKDFDIVKAVSAANNAAAKTVEKKGAQESIPWLDEL